MNSKQRAELFARFKKKQPDPKGELHFNSPFELLIAVILSAQATDKSVNQATEHLFKQADTPEKMLQLGENGIKPLIRHIGLYNNKAKNIIKTCQILIEKYRGQVPDDRQSLQSLPGVGRKTASVILNQAFGQPTIAVDTHVFRVSNRTGLAPGKTPLDVEKKLEHYVPESYKKQAHHWLILHGRYICKARRPDCSQCFIADLCDAYSS